MDWAHLWELFESFVAGLGFLALGFFGYIVLRFYILEAVEAML
jgi:preprotein translocase subunit Sss1